MTTNSPSAVGAHRVLRRRRAAQPVYLMDVSAGPGRRTTARGALWTGVLNATPDDDIDGPSPIEALLAAVAACFVRNLHSVAAGAHIAFSGVELRLAADRSDDPPAVTAIRVDADLTTEAPLATATRVVGLALGYGTMTRTLARAANLEVRVSVNGTPVEVTDGR
jgi:uncharacterized OsmC-like protein